MSCPDDKDRKALIGAALAGIGLRRLAASLIEPIRQRRDYASVGRRAFTVDVPEPCPSCKRTDFEEGHRAGCEVCTIRSVMET